MNKIIKKIKEYNSKQKEKAATKKPLTFSESLISWIKTIGGALLFVMILHSLLVASFIVPTGSMENTVMTGDFLLVNKLFGPSTPQIVPFFNIPLPYKVLPSPCEPERGDVIVFVFPGMRDEVESPEFQYYLKRCVALPGDTLQIKNNLLYVNGKHQSLPENGVLDHTLPMNSMETLQTFPKGMNFTHDNYGPIRIPKKGDTIELNALTFGQWDIFIRREGHQTEFANNSIIIDGRPTDKYIVEKDYYFGMGDNRDHSLDSRYWGFIPREHILGSPIICWLSWEMRDAYGAEYSFFEKLSKIRWNRIGKTIN